ncbi:MAG: hypothetical protein ACLFUG_05580 [Nitriliruptoraceae bacterium]
MTPSTTPLSSPPAASRPTALVASGPAPVRPRQRPDRGLVRPLTPGAWHEEPGRRAARLAHPAGRDLIAEPARADGEDGSLVTEYGLLAVVAATVAGVVIQWASGGALVTLFNALLRHARSLVGA